MLVFSILAIGFSEQVSVGDRSVLYHSSLIHIHSGFIIGYGDRVVKGGRGNILVVLQKGLTVNNSLYEQTKFIQR